MKYRVSNVERFRQFETDEEIELADLIADIKGESEPSDRMLVGTAFHKCLEDVVPGIDFDSLEANGVRFTFSDEFDFEVCPIRELRAARTFVVDGEPITISGQVDAIHGKRIEDHKTTGRFDPERYIDGYQWRLYLSIFGATEFRWNVFEIKEVDSTKPTHGFDIPPPEFQVFAQHRLTQYRYPTMEADCQALVERFARFVREHVEVAA